MCPKAQILEKSGAARAKMTTVIDTNRDLALDDETTEDSAKMTYSIPDFVSRNAINTQQVFQYLHNWASIPNTNTC